MGKLSQGQAEKMIDNKKIREETFIKLGAKGLGVDIPLPLLDEDLQILKSSSDIKNRIVALYSLTGLGNGADPKKIYNWLKKEDLEHCLEETEQIYFWRQLSNQDEIDLSWKQEALFCCCWAIGIAKYLHFPSEECDLGEIFSEIPPRVETLEFFKKTQFESSLKNKVVAELDFHYCLHWLIRHPERLNAEMFAKVSIVRERRHALEWLASNSSWSEITLDT